jgi:hypothetical protein
LLNQQTALKREVQDEYEFLTVPDSLPNNLSSFLLEELNKSVAV